MFGAFGWAQIFLQFLHITVTIGGHTNASVNLQCLTAMDYVPKPASILDFAQLSQRSASEVLRWRGSQQENSDTIVNDEARRKSKRLRAFARSCACETDWARAVCDAPNESTHIASTICVCRLYCRQISDEFYRRRQKCTQFLTRCFAGDIVMAATASGYYPRGSDRLKRELPKFVYAKGGATERGADGVLRRNWPLSQDIHRNSERSEAGGNKLALGSTHGTDNTKPNMLRIENEVRSVPLGLSNSCRCCFNQPSEYCNQLDCKNMQPVFDDERDTLFCECFERDKFPEEICGVALLEAHHESAPTKSEKSIKDKLERNGHIWRANAATMPIAANFAQRPFEAARGDALKLFANNDDDDATNAPRLISAGVVACALVASVCAAVLLALAGFVGTRHFIARWRAAEKCNTNTVATNTIAKLTISEQGRIQISTTRMDRENDIVFAEEQVYMV